MTREALSLPSIFRLLSFGRKGRIGVETNCKHIVGLNVGALDDRTMSGGARYTLEIWAEFCAHPSIAFTMLATKVSERLCLNYGYRLPATSIRTVNGSGRGRIRDMIAIMAALKRLARVDLIHAESSFYYHVLPACAFKFIRPEVSFVAPVFHLVPSPFSRPGPFLWNVAAWAEQRAMLLFLAVGADLVIVDNPDIGTALSRFGFAKERIYLTGMGVRSVKSPSNGSRLFDGVFVGRIQETKGVGVLLRAWRRVVDAEPRAKLAIVGEEQRGFDLGFRIEALNLTENVIHLKGLDDDAVRNVLMSSRFFVTASREEGYGLALLEAFACGIPAVTFDLPAFRYAFPGGRQVSEGTHDGALSAAVLVVLQDPSRLKTLAEQIKSVIVCLTWSEIANELLKRVACLPDS